jgi:hypothetical protein
VCVPFISSFKSFRMRDKQAFDGAVACVYVSGSHEIRWRLAAAMAGAWRLWLPPSPAAAAAAGGTPEAAADLALIIMHAKLLMMTSLLNGVFHFY